MPGEFDYDKVKMHCSYCEEKTLHDVQIDTDYKQPYITCHTCGKHHHLVSDGEWFG